MLSAIFANHWTRNLRDSPVLLIRGTGLPVLSLIITQFGIAISVVAPTSHIYNRHITMLSMLSALAYASGQGLLMFLFSSTNCGLHVFHLTA